MTSTTTKTAKVLTALESGQELTAKQMASQFGIGSPGRVVHSLRMAGNAIYLNTRTDTKGRKTKKYRLGTPSKRVVAAGYRAISEGLVA
jgi:predicted ArsR family transcriptional regulator